MIHIMSYPSCLVDQPRSCHAILSCWLRIGPTAVLDVILKDKRERVGGALRTFDKRLIVAVFWASTNSHLYCTKMQYSIVSQIDISWMESL